MDQAWQRAVTLKIGKHLSYVEVFGYRIKLPSIKCNITENVIYRWAQGRLKISEICS